MKKFYLFFAFCAMLLAGASMNLYAEDSDPRYVNGKFKDGGTWSFDCLTGELFIDTEKVPNYSAKKYVKETADNLPEWVNPNGYFKDLEVSYDTPWAKFCSMIRKITFSPKIKMIGDYAFRGLIQLESVEFQPSDDEANRERISVGFCAFMHCWNLKSFDFDRVKAIYRNAFASTSLQQVVLHDLESLANAFDNCPGLLRSKDPAVEPFLRPGVIYYGKVPQNIVTAATSTKYSKFSITLGDQGDSYVPFAISFSSLSDTRFDLWEKAIDEVFVDGGYLGTNTTTGQTAYWCVADTTMFIDGAFLGSIATANTYKYGWMDAVTKVKEIRFNNMLGIPAKAFTKTSYVNSAYKFEEVKRVELSGSERVIGEHAFENAVNLKSIDLSRVMSIGKNAFLGCDKLPEVNLSNIIAIGDGAFYSCDDLKYVSIGSKINNIASLAFSEDSSIEEIHMHSFPPAGDGTKQEIFSTKTTQNATLYVPGNTKVAYQKAEKWQDFQNIIEDIEWPYMGMGWQIEEDGTLLISDAQVIKKDYSSADEVPWYQMRNYVQKVQFGENAGTELGSYTCCAMPHLWEIIMPNGCTRIGAKACVNSTNLTYVNFEEGGPINGAIGESAFQGCKELKFICLGENVDKIGKNAFAGCNSLNDVTIYRNNPPQVQDNSFDVPEAIYLKIYADVSAVINYLKDPVWSRFRIKDGGNEILSYGEFDGGYYKLYNGGKLYVYITAESATEPIPFFENSPEDQQYVGTIVVAGNVRKLGRIFSNNTFPNLTEVKIQAPVTEFSHTFRGMSMNKVSFQNGNVNLGDSTFYQCKKIREVEFDKVGEIGTGCFALSGLPELVLTSTDKVGSYAFWQCDALESADISSAKSVGKMVFFACQNLTEAWVDPVSLQSGVFERCSKFHTVHLGSRVNIIDNAFSQTALKKIYYTRPYPAAGPFGGTIFDGWDLSKINLYVPKNCMDMFSTFPEWKDMNMYADPTLSEEEENAYSIPVHGVFNDNRSSWIIDENKKLTIVIMGKQEEWPGYPKTVSDKFDVTYDHPLQIWMPYFDHVEILGQNAETMQFLVPGYGGYATNYEGIKKLTIGSGVKALGYQVCPDYKKLTDVYCYPEEIPGGNKNALYWAGMNTSTHKVTLHVSAKAGVKAKYEADANWSKFAYIVADLGEPSYVVSLESMYGTIEVKEDVDLNAVPANTILHFNAIPNDGYKFVKWENYDPETGLTVTDNITVRAIFESTKTDQYDVSYVCDFTKKATSHTTYNDTWVYDNDWNVYGGAYKGSRDYLWLGGRKDIIEVHNPVHVTNNKAFDKSIKAVKVYLPKGSIRNDDMKVNEWGVKVYKDLDCRQLLYTVKADPISKEEQVVTILAPSNQLWAAGYAIQVYWDLHNDGPVAEGVVYLSKIEYMTSNEPDPEPELPSYTIRFLNWDGTELQSEQVELGMMPEYKGTTPSRPAEDGIVYVFTGWSPAMNIATEDADYTAQYFETTGLWNVQGDKVQSTKVIEDGVLLIERNGKLYNATGAEVR